MNANTIQYLDDGSIDLIDVVVGDPKENEVQVQGGACGICSWDIVTAKLGNRMHPMAPPGHEGIGYVAKVGSGVTGLNAGIEAGLGISVAASKSVSKTLRLVGKELGLPVLPPFEYRLAESPAAPAAARRLAFTIKEVFSLDDVDESSS